MRAWSSRALCRRSSALRTSVSRRKIGLIACLPDVRDRAQRGAGRGRRESVRALGFNYRGRTRKIPPSMPDSKPRSIARSEEAFLQARQVMPGGVSSPVRAFKAVGGTPLFIKDADGCRLSDVDGNEYIDYVASYGPLIAGHANERVVAALSKAIGRGTSYGAPTEAEIALAEEIVAALPSVDMVRFVNSGTEATMSAIRLARAATKRDLIVKCIGCYHGHADQLLVEAGSGALTHGTPSSPGVPASTTSTPPAPPSRNTRTKSPASSSNRSPATSA